MDTAESEQVVPEPELTGDTVALCGPDGLLNRAAVGWSRHPLHDCTLHRRWPRKKRWNYWCITSDRYLFSVTLSTLDYAGLAFVYVLDFETREFIERTWTVPFARGIEMSNTVEGRCAYEGQGIRVAFDQTSERIALNVRCSRFGNGPLEAAVAIDVPPAHESLNVVVPWDDLRYQFTSKQHALPASGTVTYNGTTIHFDTAASYACLDFGRGIWPYRCTWNWGGGSGRSLDGRIVGLNFGAEWTDGTGMTENGVLVDGVLRKISDTVDFEYDPRAFMEPWHIKTRHTDEIDLVFTPFYERIAKSNLLIIQSEVHQLIGAYSGTVLSPKGEPTGVEPIIRWAEEHIAKW